MTHQARQVEVFYRFACKSCGFARQTKDKARIPDKYCPGCCYPKDLAGHIYRPEPQDGEELDG